MKITMALSLIACSFITTLGADTIFSSYPNAKEKYVQVLSGEQVRLLTSYSPQNKKDQRATFIEAIGDVSHYHYTIKNTSSLAIFENYQHAFKEAGLEIVFSCSKQKCGDRADNNALKKLAAYFQSGNSIAKTRYIYAKREGENPIAVSLFVSQHKGNAEALLTEVKIQDIPLGLVSADPTAFSNQVEKDAPDRSKKDAKGSTDHSLLTRYPGSYIWYYRHVDYDEISLPNGFAKDKKSADPTLEVVGDITRFTYITENVSTLKINRNYVAALIKEGFETVFACEKEHCGKKPKEIGNSLAVEGNTYSYNDQPRYQLMKSTIDGISTYVALYVGGYKNKSATQLAIVRTEPLEKGLITSNSEQIQKQLEQKGKASIYGIFFDYDKAVVKADSKPALDEISKVLIKNKQLKLYVVGHTDDKGSTDYNIRLSSKRAAAVVDNLVKHYSIAKKRLEAYGVGPYSPAASNTTQYGRQLNRRVELVVQLAQ